jgi:predicted metalloprotease with PDZ domain
MLNRSQCAEHTDLLPSDIITAVDGHSVTSAGSLAHEIHRLEVGQTIQLEVWQEDRLETIDATLGEREWGHAHRFETVVVRCSDDDSDCECLVNGEPADCAEVSGFAHTHGRHHPD